jgi:uncharacterized membrane protein
MIIADVDSYNSFRVTFKPNSALTADNKIKVVILLAIIPLLIGVGFSLIGAWLVMPFVGLEILALAIAFYYINNHEADYESISIDGDSLVVERSTSQQVSQDVINPYWVKILQHKLPNGELHLYLQSHGKEIEVGRYLTSEQRELLAKQLKQRTGMFNGNQ